MELTCPKCRGMMRTYERNGITVDQCDDCRGIFLDRGELERLIDAEAAFNAAAPGPPPSPRSPVYGSPPPLAPGPQAPRRDDDRAPRYDPGRDRFDSERARHDSDRGRYDADRGRYDSDRERYESGRDHSRPDDYYRKKRKRSFLEDLFD